MLVVNMPRPAAPPLQTCPRFPQPHLAAAHRPAAIAGGDLDGFRCIDVGTGTAAVATSGSFLAVAAAGGTIANSLALRSCAHATVLGQQVVVDGGSAHHLLQGLGQAECERDRGSKGKKSTTRLMRTETRNKKQ